MSFLSKNDFPRGWFLGFVLLHLVFWTLTPVLLHHTAPLDITEAIAWGQQWQWGYDHDPYLVAWLAYGLSFLAGMQVWPIYLFSQVCVLTAFWAIWRLGLQLGLSRAQAFFSFILLEAVFYYNFATPEFNDNVLQLPLWTLTVSFLYTALKQQKTRDWIFTGLCAGLSLMAKYYSVMLFVPLALMILGTTEGRQSFKKPGIYCAFVLGLIIILPNLFWQYQHGFQYLHYAVSRAKVESTWVNHLYYPLLFAGNQLLVLLPCFLFYGWSVRTYRKNREVSQGFDSFFLGMVTWGPFVMTLAYSALTGTHMLSMWGMPLFSFVGLWVVYRLWPVLEDQQSRRIIQGALACFFAALIGYVGTIVLPPFLVGHAKTVAYPSEQLAKEVVHYWHQYYPQTLHYVAGTPRELASRVTVYDGGHPTSFFEWNPASSPWVDQQRLRRDGGVFLWDVGIFGEKVPVDALSAYPELCNPVVVELKWHTRAKLKPVRVGLAILPPQPQFNFTTRNGERGQIWTIDK